VQETSALLTDKLKDVAFLYRELENQLRDRYTDPDDYLNLLADNIHRSEIFKNAEFWIDGFKGFTPQELKVIEAIMQVAGTVNAALCINHEGIKEGVEENELFSPTWETYRQLQHIGAKVHAEMAEPVVFSDNPVARFQSAGDIAHLEKHFFNYPAPIYGDTPDKVRIVAAANRRAEVEACAREIIRQARNELRRWRDTTVLIRDLESYYDLVTGIFSDHDIPFFIDHKHKVMHHPLVELIRSALEDRPGAY